ncbi:single-stranded-DNA-specific exonuclease RecJ [Alteribacillus sp. HJP-4]|uniref:single-stranded-DNA-specific exonuclease RecJ n=1 Tax=Alteribacillus sp. HJP-4 TaxID=2775394 RepID=UPI0035CCE4FA
MLKPKTRWNVAHVDETASSHMQQELKISTLTAKMLCSRGITSIEAAKDFLSADTANAHDPFLMDGMSEAVDRIRRAIDRNEKILIFGDYDADGVSSTTIMIMLLQELKADFGWYIPNRFTEGYGPNIPAFRKAKEEGAGLIITVDTGIAAVEPINTAKELGMDVIVTDHHEPPPQLPDAYCIINPKKPGCMYPFKELAGAGVAFKLAQALLGSFPEHILDIFTIGTISDLVPLLDENRALVKEGLKKLSSSDKPGIKALKKICSIDGETIEEEHVGFAMGPRINAAGRMEAADPAVHLLNSTSMDEADEWADMINNLNKERQKVVNEMTKEAVEVVETHYPPESNNFLIIGKEGWNPGVIGIVASRLVERFYRPVIVLSIDEDAGTAKGSARSIEGFDMFQELSKNRELLPHFGGHPMAAGLTMSTEHVDELRKKMSDQAGAVLSADDFIPSTKIDFAVTLQEINLQSVEELNKLAPYGIGNPKPAFAIKGINIASFKKIGSEKNHLKLGFESEGKNLDCVGFHLGHLADQLTEKSTAEAVGELSINEWNGFRKPQLFLKDIAIVDWQLFDKRKDKDVISAIKEIPAETAIILAFKEKTARVLADKLPDYEINSSESAKKNIIIADMPASLEEFENTAGMLQGAEKIFIFFHEKEDVYFQMSPGREHFKWYYAFLKKRGTFELEKYGKELAKRKGWLPETVKFMTKVFFELGFVKIDNGVLTVVEQAERKDLSESASYVRFLKKREAEKELLYSSYSQLKSRLHPLLEPDHEHSDIKEKVGNGF